MTLFVSLFLLCRISSTARLTEAAAFFTSGVSPCMRMMHHHHHINTNSVLSFAHGGRSARHRRALLLSGTALSLSSSSDKNKNNDAEQERMALVRQLQKSFYAPSSSEQKKNDNDDNDMLHDDEQQRGVQIDHATGRVLNLPLWRVGWVEVPGRTNCLNVHEGHYTNMFEKILAQQNNRDDADSGDDDEKKNWWFGHLHLPGGTANARSGQERFELKDWRMEIADDTRFDQKERSAVIGTLMRITDYRRLKDGRLCLLVQAVDRFVVDHVLQSFPHGLAHVQILPDTDHYNNEDEIMTNDENLAKVARAALVREAFQCYDYECHRLVLPLPKDDEYMATDAVFGIEIARQLPFCSFSPTDDSLRLLDERQNYKDDATTRAGSKEGGKSDNKNATIKTGGGGGGPRLEDLLQADLILRNPVPLPGVIHRFESNTTADALEKLLWLALEDLCRNYKFQLPPEIMCLLPPEMNHLDFKKQQKPDGAGVQQQQQQQQHPVQQQQLKLSAKYPVRRRQQRLSYAVPALMERTNIDGSSISTRQMLLNTPSTRARLAVVLERIEVMNAAIMGQFE
jgi:type II secretory pathway pseudopilin PulG